MAPRSCARVALPTKGRRVAVPTQARLPRSGAGPLPFHRPAMPPPAGRCAGPACTTETETETARSTPGHPFGGGPAFCLVRRAEDTRFELVRVLPQHAFQACAL